MSSTRSEAARRGARRRWSQTPPEQRRANTAAARREYAIREIVDNWPELTESQVTRLRGLLRPPEGGGRDGT
jgi:hypothetical protein